MQEHKYSIKEWAKDDRPREKLLYTGAENLSNSELLAILIQTGNRHKSAIDLAKEVLKLGKDSLAELGKLSVKELMKIKGIGEAKAITIAASMELCRRRQSAAPIQREAVRASQDIARLLQIKFRDHRHEVFAVLYLNRANKIKHFEVVSEGGISGTIADPRIILRKALEQDAVSLILCHNHPSGSLKPSRADEQLTFKIKEAAGFFDINILDHIIVSEDGYFSFADEGII
ncbi:MAG: DNA repair protein RadC [Sphingobacteriales bacterium]|nr:DNA repair protein RadC [Sphingobacteriales bacterium]